jgi:hypothetical protein
MFLYQQNKNMIRVILLWRYKELYSCPLVVILGSFNYNGLNGFVTLPVVNMRLNVLISRDNEVRIVSNISRHNWYEQLKRVCLSICLNEPMNLSVLEKVIATSMFYGGLGIYVVNRDSVSILSLDFVNKRKHYFYVLPSDFNTNFDKARLEDWVILQFALREGDSDLLLSVCNNAFREKGMCKIITSHGLLRISDREICEDNWIRIIPDNAPLRHVISVS